MELTFIKNYFSRKGDGTNHIAWIDFAKGLGIFLVVLGHLWYVCPNREVLNAIYSFHVPFFFVLSGLVFNTKGKRFLPFLINKIKRVFIPLLFFIVLAIIVGYTFYKNVFSDPQVALESFTLWNGEIYCNKPVYFLLILFELYLVMYALFRIGDGVFEKIIWLVMFIILGFVTYHYKVFIPFGMNRMICIAPFFIAGSLIRDFLKAGFKIKKRYYVITAIISAGLWILFGVFLNSYVSVYSFNLGKYGLFLISGLFGSVFFILASMLLSKINFLYFINLWGKNSVFIMGTHFVATIGPVWLFRNYVTEIGFNTNFAISFVVPAFALALLLVYIPVCFIADCLIPWFAGKKQFLYSYLFSKVKRKQN